VILRALTYVEEHSNAVVHELFKTEGDLRFYLKGLKRKINQKRSRQVCSDSELRLIKEHLQFGDKTLRPATEMPTDGGVLHLANKARKKPLKIKASAVTTYLSAGNPDKRLPLVDRLNKAQADMTAALLSPPGHNTGTRRHRNSVQFKHASSNQSSSSSIETFANPRPPTMDMGEGGSPIKGSRGGPGRRNSHRKIVSRDDSDSAEHIRRSSAASVAGGEAGAGGEGGVHTNTSPRASFSRDGDRGSASASAGGADASGDSSSSRPGSPRARLPSEDRFGSGAEDLSLGMEDALTDEAGRSRVASMDTVGTGDLTGDLTGDDGDTSGMRAPIAPPSGTSTHSFRNRKNTTNSNSNSNKDHNTETTTAPTAPTSGKPSARRPKSERQRSRRLAMPARYENEAVDGSSKIGYKLTSADLKNASRIAEVRVLIFIKKLNTREKYINIAINNVLLCLLCMHRVNCCL
jgi:hypothetical protein